MNEEKKQEAVVWLKENLIPRKVGGRLTFDCSAMAVWERAGKPWTTFRQWWQKTKKSCKLKEGTDFQTFRMRKHTKPSGVSNKGGRPGMDNLLTADAAKVVMMGDDSEAGLALRWALVDLLNRIESGDPELIDYMLQKVKTPEQVERVIKTAQERITEMYLRQGKSPTWIAQRLQGMTVRNWFTGILKSHGVLGIGYATIADGMYQELFGAVAKELKEERGIPDSKPARDGLTLVELCKTSLAEALSMEALEEINAQGNRQCRTVCLTEARKVAQVK